MRDRPGVVRRVAAGTALLALGVSLALVSGSCAEEMDPRLRPDSVLVDALGLDERDRVHRVRLMNRDGAEEAVPREVTIRPGAWVEFRVADRGLHTVAFELDSLGPAAAEVVRRDGQDASPPLLESGARFLVSFEEAPPGRYPYRVEGTGRPFRGAVVVEAPS